ncbi:cytochrome P450 [Aspergillus pseudoustus]|uniref:Cytochrome P450 n=1 Tax=Aspergillus pseudoustus TaxID=1810923 RepID=A0ABR4K3J8_9EURO
MSVQSTPMAREAIFCSLREWLNIGAAVVITLFLYVAINEFVRAKQRLPNFDGPRGLPLIGNLHQIRRNAGEQYRKWSAEYGPVYQVQLGNVPVLIVNTAAAAKAIFAQNSQAVSSRPEFYTFHKVLSNTAGTTIGTSPYSDSLKRRRKGVASALNRPAVQTYVPHLDIETKDFCKELLDYGHAGTVHIDPLPMIQRFSLSLSLSLNWGTRIDSHEDPLFREITHVEEQVSRFRSTTGNLQDYVPILRLSPFNSSSRKARNIRRRRDVYLAQLNHELDERIANGTHKPCIQANVILNKETAITKAELTSISLTMLNAGLDTLTAVIAWSIALLAQRPEIQDKAFDEISRIFGTKEPLCDAADDGSCRYVVALIRECLRYYTVLRLALPHSSVREITYEGKRIPRGTVMFLNAWACNLDPQTWEDPEAFRPERWFDHAEAPMFTYGMGYRMCAGSLLANRELYLIFIRLINSFRIERVASIDVDPTTGIADPTNLVMMPRRYEVRFVPRNTQALRRSIADFVVQG